MKLILRCIAIAVMVTPVSALANSWSCTHNKLIRTVSIETEAGSTACKVNYTKETEGVPMKTLWNATNDTSYCTEKAEGFIAKLTSWGWACTKDVAEPAAAESAAAPAASSAPAEAAPAEAAPAAAPAAEPAAPAKP